MNPIFYSLETAYRKTGSLQDTRCFVSEYLDSFIADIKSGRRLCENDNYSIGTIIVWECFRKIVNKFDPCRELTWQSITRETVTNFVTMLAESGYMVTTINKYLICFRALVNYSFADQYHKRTELANLFCKIKVSPSQKAVEIYLTRKELEGLEKMTLSGAEDKVRDIFLVGCYLAQRVSDYAHIRREAITQTSRGVKVIRLVQKKTRNPVVIPILSDNLLNILDKYNYELPCMSEQFINRVIKRILFRLSAKIPSLRETISTQLTMKQRQMELAGKMIFERNESGSVVRPRYECVTTHTARRTGITLLYLTHCYTTLQMMSISGHRSEKTFRSYIKLTDEEIAEEIAVSYHQRKKRRGNNSGLKMGREPYNKN